MSAPKDPEKYKLWKANISKANKGKNIGNKNAKGMTPWNKGLTKETNKNVLECAEKKKGQKRPDIVGDLNPAKRPEIRKKISENNARFWENKNPFEKLDSHPCKDEKVRKKISNSISKIWKNPDYLHKMTGKNSHAWKGGISYEPYCDQWLDKTYKEFIKERDEYKCQNPYCNNISDKLCIHHINYTKKECSQKNLITLCNSCNGRANYKRDIWQFIYTNLIIEKYFKIRIIYPDKFEDLLEIYLGEIST